MKLTYFAIAAGIFFAACTSPESDSASKEQVESAASGDLPYEVINIQEEGFNIDVAIPNEYRQGNKLVVNFDEAFGHLNVRSGEVFSLEITQEKGSLQSLLGRLEDDLVFKYQLIDESMHGAIYRQYLPDGGQEFWHVYFNTNQNGQDYVVEDASMSELNEYQSRKIYDALDAIYGQGDGEPS